jgi:hypothetical protein
MFGAFETAEKAERSVITCWRFYEQPLISEESAAKKAASEALLPPDISFIIRRATPSHSIQPPTSSKEGVEVIRFHLRIPQSLRLTPYDGLSVFRKSRIYNGLFRKFNYPQCPWFFRALTTISVI